MRSFEYGYLLETPMTHALAMTMRALGEFRGRKKTMQLLRLGRTEGNSSASERSPHWQPPNSWKA